MHFRFENLPELLGIVAAIFGLIIYDPEEMRTIIDRSVCFVAAIFLKEVTNFLLRNLVFRSRTNPWILIIY